jgi:hypothetical protein
LYIGHSCGRYATTRRIFGNSRRAKKENVDAHLKDFCANAFRPRYGKEQSVLGEKMMKAPLVVVNLVMLNVLNAGVLLSQTEKPPNGPPQPHVSKLTIDAQNVTVLRLRPGFVTSVRLPEEVSSVVLGNPQEFKAEHSEAEPRLVFLKPLTAKPSETNALITTRSGHEIPLHLVSNGKAGGGDVDFFLDYERQRSFMIQPAEPSFSIGETRTLNVEATPQSAKPDEAAASVQQQLLRQTKASLSDWTGKQLQVAVGQVSENREHMTVAFSVLNNSDSTLELLPPQIRLCGPSKQKHGSKIKDEPVAINEYSMNAQRLGPGRRADGVVVFERPSFKESSEQLFLQVAQAEQVDHPVLVPISFTAPIARNAQ